MGEVRTEITLVNIGDQNDANRGYIPQEAVRRLTVNALVDTGAGTLVINEAVREKLGLRVEEKCDVELADGSTRSYGITETVTVQWKNRKTGCEAVVMADSTEALLGAIPLEGLDLMIHPSKQEVTGAHGDRKIYFAK